MISGCNKPEYELDKQSDIKYSGSRKNDLVLGKRLEDPFAIHNIRQAYSNLKLTRREIPPVDLKPNHIYLRFLPENEEELKLLKSDSTMILYDYPLNMEFTQSGTYYNDPTLPDSSIVWQYSVVPTGKVLPEIHHEVIYEVFIPPDGDSGTKGIADELARFYEDLECESCILTGNYTKIEEQSENTKGLFSSKWIPKGTIRVWDDLLGRYIPLAHVNVHARWFTRIETDLTDENGYFQTKPFRYKVNYSIKWENSLFTIRRGLFFQAWYNGPRMKGDWNLDIKGGESVMYATIHRAAYKHFYGDNLGLFRPMLRSGGRTKICYINENGRAEFRGDWTASGIFPDILIWGKSNGILKTTDKIFGSTAHELGHQAHSQYLGNIKYYRLSKIIRESWADAVEWALANDEYHKLGIKYDVLKAINYNHNYNTHNRWPYVDDKNYSPIFIDLMDRINQRQSLGEAYPNDMVSGYSLSFINYYLLGNSENIISLREQVRNHKITEVDDYQIEELFKLYSQ